MRILVVGGGGREHALVWKLAQSPRVTKIYCAPGNPGIAAQAECVNISADNVKALCEIVAMHDNLVPDVSLGTHFINELIEDDMLYFALFPKMEGNRIDEKAIRRQPNRLSRIVPEAKQWAGLIRVVDIKSRTLVLYADAERQRVTLTVESPSAPKSG